MENLVRNGWIASVSAMVVLVVLAPLQLYGVIPPLFGGPRDGVSVAMMAVGPLLCINLVTLCIATKGGLYRLDGSRTAMQPSMKAVILNFVYLLMFLAVGYYAVAEGILLAPFRSAEAQGIDEQFVFVLISLMGIICCVVAAYYHHQLSSSEAEAPTEPQTER